MTDDTSTFLAKEPCPACGSRDNLARYTDGHGYCFGCGHYEHAEGTSTTTDRRPKMAAGLITGGEYRALTSRGISEETCRKFGYQVAKLADGRTVQVAPYTDADGNVIGQKVRPKDKDKMFSTGDMKDALLFGQHLWGSGGKKVVVTEGEIDCMSVSQMQGNRWPVVSVPNGAGKQTPKAIARQLEWLCSFEEVILMFDMDEPGRDASVVCAGLFPPGKCKVATLPMKDPNELLVAGKGDQIVTAIWNAKPYRPDGVVTIADVREQVLREPKVEYPWCFDELTALTYGRRLGEIYAYGAGTGVGKTDLLTQQMQYDMTTLKEPIAVFALEQQPVETTKRLAGKFAGKRFHIPDGSWTRDELTSALDTLEGAGKLFMYDNFGATDWDIIKATIRYLAHSEGVRLFYLDHLTALAAAEDDERTALERIMSEMGALVKELNIIIHLVSHLSTPEGKPHEEGGRVMIRHFKGSRSIGYWCHFMFGLERDQQAEDRTIRSTTTFRVLKDRYTGKSTGEVLYLGYDTDCGKLYVTEAPKEGPFEDASGGDF